MGKRSNQIRTNRFPRSDRKRKGTANPFGLPPLAAEGDLARLDQHFIHVGWRATTFFAFFFLPLMWHVCRANFGANLFSSSYEFSYENCSDIFPGILEPSFCGSGKISQKFPAKFLPKFPCEEIFTNELLQKRREIIPTF